MRKGLLATQQLCSCWKEKGKEGLGNGELTNMYLIASFLRNVLQTNVFLILITLQWQITAKTTTAHKYNQCTQCNPGPQRCTFLYRTEMNNDSVAGQSYLLGGCFGSFPHLDLFSPLLVLCHGWTAGIHQDDVHLTNDLLWEWRKETLPIKQVITNRNWMGSKQTGTYNLQT